MGSLMSIMGIDDLRRLTGVGERHEDSHGDLMTVVAGEVQEVVGACDHLSVDLVDLEALVVLAELGVDRGGVVLNERLDVGVALTGAVTSGDASHFYLTD